MQTLTTQTLFTNAFGSTTPMATSLLTMSCMFRPWVLYGEHLAMAKTSTQTLSIVQRRTRFTNFRGKSCSLLTMSCMFLPWSLNAGNGEAWQQRCAAILYILVLDWHIFTNPWLIGIDKDWLVDSGWGWIPKNNTRVAETLFSVDRSVTCSCLAVFVTWHHQHRLRMCNWQCRFARNCVWVEKNIARIANAVQCHN